VGYVIEWVGAPIVIGAVALLSLPLFPGFALLALWFSVLVAAAVLLALVGATIATPYLLARHLRRRWLAPSAARRASVQTSRETGRSARGGG